MAQATRADEKNFVLDFLQESEQTVREPQRTLDQEVLSNYLVNPQVNSSRVGPYAGIGFDQTHTSRYTPVNLKSSATHAAVEALVAKQLNTTITDSGFVQAEAWGREDAFSARLVSKLLENTFRRRTNYWAMYVGYKDMDIFGSSVLFPHWRFEQTTRPVSRVAVDPLTGAEFRTSGTELVTDWDDIQLEVIDRDDFFPDPSNDRMENMLGAARRFLIPAHQAQEMADKGIWSKEGVKRAIRNSQTKEMSDRGKGSANEPKDGRQNTDWRESRDRHRRTFTAGYAPLIGYEWYGEVPYTPRDGVRVRRLVLLNEEWVASGPAPLRISRKIPMYDLTINPMKGRWNGVSPASVMRFQQSFLDALMICSGEIALREACPPVLYNELANIDPEMIEDWRGPIPTSDMNGVKAMDFNANLQDAFAMMQIMKQEMEGSSGANQVVTEGNFGTKRITGQEAQLQSIFANNRPNAQISYLQREPLPAIGEALLQLYQQFIFDTPELHEKVGRSMVTGRMPRLTDIQGQWDLRFVGSDRIPDRAVQLQLLERAASVIGNVPGAAPQFPWGFWLSEWFRLTDQRDLEALMLDPNAVEDNVSQFVENVQRQGVSGTGGSPTGQPSLATPGGQAGGTGLLPAPLAAQ